MFAVITCLRRVELYVDNYPVQLAIAVDALSIFISAPLFKPAFPNTSLVRYDAQSNQSVSSYPPPHLFSPHQNLTKLSPPILSPLFNNVAISTLNGLSTSGYASN